MEFEMGNKQVYKTKCHVVEKPWGGEFLSKRKSLQVPNLGETWEISAISDGECLIDGKKLSEFLADFQLPKLEFLVKFIDTSDNLSIQVHPGDEYARVHEQTLGKTECWLILHAEAGAGIYLGFRPGVDSREFEACIRENGDLTQFLVFHPAKKGDFFYVPSGTVHAIGSGICLAEVQQASGVTYRVWDWNRVDDQGRGRELHVEKALDVLEFSREKNTSEYFRIERGLLSLDQMMKPIVEHPNFHVELVALAKGDRFVLPKVPDGIQGLTILEGECSIQESLFASFESAIIRPHHETIELQAKAPLKFLLIR